MSKVYETFNDLLNSLMTRGKPRKIQIFVHYIANICFGPNLNNGLTFSCDVFVELKRRYDEELASCNIEKSI